MFISQSISHITITPVCISQNNDKLVSTAMGRYAKLSPTPRHSLFRKYLQTLTIMNTAASRVEYKALVFC